MPSPLPQLSLTFGQIAWILGGAKEPTPELLSQLRHFRTLGIPFKPNELGQGRGNRMRYSYDHCMEIRVAQVGQRRGIKPSEMAVMLINNRSVLRPLYRKAFQEQPEELTGGPIAKDAIRLAYALKDELFIRFRDHNMPRAGEIDILDRKDYLTMNLYEWSREVDPADALRTLMPITRMAIELVAIAREVPHIRPGPQ
jgi:hypothetical protein